MKALARKNIIDLKPYKPGKPIEELQRELGISESEIIKLASNENPIGPSPKAVKAIYRSIKGINRYPDGSCFYLKRKLAAKLKVKPQNILFGNGSDEIIDIITKTFLGEDEEAIICEPSFLEYKIIVKTRGAKIKTIPMQGPVLLKGGIFGLKAFSYDIDKILKAVSRKTKLIFLGNPDNPTGAYLNKKELNLLLNNCPEGVIIVFDEAYREFTEAAGYSNPFNYIGKKNIIVLRTFSKAYGLAGLRIGYALADKRLIGYMERTRQPFNVNSPAQIAALAALDDRAHILKSKKVISQGKKFLIDNLKSLGLDIIVSPANFILFSCKGTEGEKIFKRLLPYGVIIRSMNAYGLNRWVRVNAGTMPENRKFINTLKRIITKV